MSTENNNPDLNEEENMFLAEERNGSFSMDDDDDDDDIIHHEENLSNPDWSEPKENNDPENTGDLNLDPAKKTLFEEPEKQENENDEKEFSEDELATLNKKLGTDFKSSEELKKSFQKEEAKDELQQETTKLQTLTNQVSYIDRFLEMEDEDLVRQQFLFDAQQEKKDVNDQDVLDEIDEKIEGMKELKTLASHAKLLRSDLNTHKTNAEKSIKKIESDRAGREEEVKKANVEGLQNAFAEIYEQKTFMGVPIDQEVIKKVYKDIREDNFFKSVNGDHRKIAKLAMMLELEEQIRKRATAPTPSERNKSAFEHLANNGKEQKRTLAKGSATASGSDTDLARNFIK